MLGNAPNTKQICQTSLEGGYRMMMLVNFETPDRFAQQLRSRSCGEEIVESCIQAFHSTRFSCLSISVYEHLLEPIQ